MNSHNTGNFKGSGKLALYSCKVTTSQSLLLGANEPGPQLEMPFSKFAASVQVTQEFFMALIGLKQRKTNFVVAATSSP